MINLLPIPTLFRWVAALYAMTVVVILALFRIWSGGQSFSDDLAFAASGAAVVQVLLFLLFHVGWRRLWKLVPALNRWIFPDINGEWKMEIHWSWNNKSGRVDATAIMHQTFLTLGMEVVSQGSRSQTLVAVPRRTPESASPFLYYVYLTSPYQIGVKPPTPYYGAAILRFDDIGRGKLSGNYWTSEGGRGHFRLCKNGVSTVDAAS